MAPEHERRHDIFFGPTARFTNTTSWTSTLPECVRASYWWKTPVALTALCRTIEMEYTASTSFHIT